MPHPLPPQLQGSPHSDSPPKLGGWQGPPPSKLGKDPQTGTGTPPKLEWEAQTGMPPSLGNCRAPPIPPAPSKLGVQTGTGPPKLALLALNWNWEPSQTGKGPQTGIAPPTGGGEAGLEGNKGPVLNPHPGRLGARGWGVGVGEG